MTAPAPRLVVVLGYSEGGDRGLHPVCARRLAHAAAVSRRTDVVVLSGWARTPRVRPEAELMAQAWTGVCRELVVDPDARHTLDNASNAVDDLVRSGVDTVLVVTSRWHAPRARAIFTWVFRGVGASVTTTSPPERVDVRHLVREVPRWFALPLQLAVSGRRRRRDGIDAGPPVR